MGLDPGDHNQEHENAWTTRLGKKVSNLNEEKAYVWRQCVTCREKSPKNPSATEIWGRREKRIGRPSARTGKTKEGSKRTHTGPGPWRFASEQIGVGVPGKSLQSPLARAWAAWRDKRAVFQQNDPYEKTQTQTTTREGGGPGLREGREGISQNRKQKNWEG